MIVLHALGWIVGTYLVLMLLGAVLQTVEKHWSLVRFVGRVLAWTLSTIYSLLTWEWLNNWLNRKKEHP